MLEAHHGGSISPPTTTAKTALCLEKELPQTPEKNTNVSNHIGTWATYSESTGKSKASSHGQSCKSWSPVSYSLTVLGCLVLTTLGLIVVLQYLSWHSQADGGILFADTVNDLSTSQVFLYLYLPVVITVVYGLVWAWIDLNARRLEPYYAMARASGAKASASILLDYTSDFIAFVPLKAARHR